MNAIKSNVKDLTNNIALNNNIVLTFIIGTRTKAVRIVLSNTMCVPGACINMYYTRASRLECETIELLPGFHLWLNGKADNTMRS